MNEKKRLVSGILFVAVYAAAALLLRTNLGTQGGGLVRFLAVFVVGVGATACLFGWIPALTLFLASLVLTDTLFHPFALLKAGEIHHLVHLAVYSVLSLSAIRVVDRRRKTIGRAEERYRLVVESASDGILMTDSAGNYLWANSKACEMLGYSRMELFDFNVRDLVVPQNLGPWPFQSPGSPSGTSQLRECRALRKDGTFLTLEVSGKMLTDGRFMAILRDVTERKKAEEQIRASLREKEVLLKEIHHRVKNNLQIISSLLSLQAGYVQEPRALAEFTSCLERIKSIALLHEKLYLSHNLARIDFAEYTRDLAGELAAVYQLDPNAVTLQVQADDVSLDLDTAIPCGLIINELVSNALKHAFPAGLRGEIYIGLASARDHTVTLTVRDTGVGMPEDLDLRNEESLGLRLVSTLAAQLKGTVEVHNNGGTEFKVAFTHN